VQVARSRLGVLAIASALAVFAVAPMARAQYPDPLYSPGGQPCVGPNIIRGLGDQDMAHRRWGAALGGPDWALPAAQGFGYDTICDDYRGPVDGGTKSIEYLWRNSEEALAAFSATDLPGAPPNTTVDFATTDKPPTQTQLSNASSQGRVLHTIPIGQFAVAVAVRLPDGCEIPTAAARSLSRAEVEGAFAARPGTSPTANRPYDQWYELFGSTNVKASPGSGLTDAQCGAKKFKRVVNLGDSGSTFVFKKYLQQAAAGAFDWREPSQGGTLLNAAWPNDSADSVALRSSRPGDLLRSQGANGGIGYLDLARARGYGFGWDYSGGSIVASDRTLWVYVQNVENDTYLSPAKTDNQAGAKGARCTGVTYANQPANTKQSWYSTVAVRTASDYAICALTYALTWGSLSAVGIHDTSRAPGRRDYIGYMLDRPGLGTTPPSSQCDPKDSRYGRGQCKLPTADYARLPADVFTKARNGMVQLGP
jgi:hypothetical protein